MQTLFASLPLSFFSDLGQQFYDDFILKDRYMYIVQGFGNTVAITLVAVIIGIILGTLVALVRITHQNNPKKLRTPGINRAKNKLGNYMLRAAEGTLRDVDVILWLVEPTTFIGAGERYIIEQLKKAQGHTPVILVINKTDTVKKDEVFPAIDAYRKELDFAEIVPVSARTGANTDELIRCILKYLPYGDPFYDEDTVTDQPERQIVAELIREKALRCLGDEVPHGIAVAVERMKQRGQIMDIEATIICEGDSHKGIIIGKGGAMLKTIGSKARVDIGEMLGCRANLQLWVKVKRDWRDSDFLLKNFGYNPKDTV